MPSLIEYNTDEIAEVDRWILLYRLKTMKLD